MEAEFFWLIKIKFDKEELGKSQPMVAKLYDSIVSWFEVRIKINVF